MSIYDIWPTFLVMGILLLVFSHTPVFKFIDDPPGGNLKRISTLDGLRGFLALGVFFHHSVINYVFIQSGGWTLPPSRFYAMLGQASVAVFFMISGFLFWEKLIREKERISWSKLYIGRLFRIGPIYLVAVLFMLAIVFVRSGFELRQPGLKVAGETARWLGLGLTGHPDINGVQYTSLILMGTWSLHYEWVYYLSLRLTHYVAIRKPRLVLILLAWAVSLIATYFRPGEAATSTALFLSGMAAATLIEDGFRPKLDTKWAALAALACLVIAFSAFDEVKSGLCVLLLAVFFFIICRGNGLFGLLTCKPAQRLGHISYSIYLMQGIVLTVFYWSGAARSFSLSSAAVYWLTIMFCGLILTGAASVLYVLVERPGIALGRKLGNAAALRLR